MALRKAANMSACVACLSAQHACGRRRASPRLTPVDLCPVLSGETVQRRGGESAAECHRGNSGPTTPDLSDGKRRRRLVIASFWNFLSPVLSFAFCNHIPQADVKCTSCREQRVSLCFATATGTGLAFFVLHTPFHKPYITYWTTV